ncbi:MAG: divergent polysaccharide deacetylase family protein [Candidatus Omnitrophota bacterium]
MVKTIKAALLAVLIITPIIFYKSLSKKNDFSPFSSAEAIIRPQIALIFDDLGESLNDLKEIYSLGIPLTVSIIPGLKFSKNIAHIASRCGLSVFIHLPLQPKNKDVFKTNKYRFINSDLSQRETIFLLRRYLNSIRISIGINNHMGSKATEDPKLMEIILKEIKKRGLVFVDSRTSLESVAYKIAREEGMICGYNEGFLDSIDDLKEITGRMSVLIEKAKEKGKIIIIAHPRKNTIDFLKERLPALEKEVEFITIKEYFDL